MKNYIFKFQDKEKNTLYTRIYSFLSIKQARERASLLLANSMENDLCKIKVELIK